VLQLIEREELSSYLKFLHYPCNEAAVSHYWTKTGGSLRFIINKAQLRTDISLAGPSYAILVWLYSQQVHKDVNQITKIPITFFERQKQYWSDNNILYLPPAIIYDLIDDCTLSMNEKGQGSTIGFGHPGQFLILHEMNQNPDTLNMEEQSWLLDPKTYGEKLEWFLESCLRSKIITKKHVLCLNNQSSDFKDPHQDILLCDWKPLGEHKGLVMKLYPDDYGIDMIEVKVNEEIIELCQHQSKLGGSSMSPGNSKTRDSVNHMLSHWKNSSKILRCLETRLHRDHHQKIIVTNHAYITRILSSASKDLIKKEGISLYDRKNMLENVWSEATIKFAQSIDLKWIIDVK